MQTITYQVRGASSPREIILDNQHESKTSNEGTSLVNDVSMSELVSSLRSKNQYDSNDNHCFNWSK